VAGFSWFIIVYFMHQGDPGAAGTWPAWFGTVSALSTCFLVIPIITYISQKIGKKNTFLVSQAVSIVGYALFWWCFQPGNPLMMFVPLPLFAFGIGGLFTLMMSMTADVCDLDELSTGSRREGTFAAIYWWMVKFGFAVAGLMSGLILKFVGFDQNLAVQTPHALAGLRLAYIIVPTAGTLLAMIVMLRYDLSEQKAHEIRRELEVRRGVS
jgi:GPH family glycoside/pentoside/hexuronide:cation symporter